jgi:hypothetical protein
MIFRSPWPDIESPAVSVCDAVLGKAREFGKKPAVIEGETGSTLTYRHLVQCAERVAAGLTALVGAAGFGSHRVAQTAAFGLAQRVSNHRSSSSELRTPMG